MGLCFVDILFLDLELLVIKMKKSDLNDVIISVTLHANLDDVHFKKNLTHLGGA
jgi:hypothetical protein